MPKNTGVGSLSLLQGNFLTQESNWGLLHCRVSEFMASHSFSFCFSITLAQPRLPLQKPNSLSFEGVLDTRIHPAPPRHCLLWSRQLSPSTAPCRASLWDSGHLPSPTSTPTQVVLLVLLTPCCTHGCLVVKVTWELSCPLVAEGGDAVQREGASLKTCHQPPSRSAVHLRLDGELLIFS